MSDTLFDISPEEVPDKKKPKKARKKAAETLPGGSDTVAEASFSVKAASAPVEARVVVVEGVVCVDERCGCCVHDVTTIGRNWWRLECWACGTGQWVEPSQEMLAMGSEKAPEEENSAQVSGEFVFDDGWLAGKTIPEVAAECGVETVKMLAGDARHPKWRVPLENWLAENGVDR